MTTRPSYFVDAKELNNVIAKINELSVPHAHRSSQPLASNGANEELQLTRARLRGRYTDIKQLPSLNPTSVVVARIEPVTLPDVDHYLQASKSEFRRHCGVNWQQVKSFLLKVYDLRDLMKRPILLSIIRDTILYGEIDIRNANIKLGVAGLYETYTSINFDRDWDKGSQRRLLSVEGRQLFCEQVAFSMLKARTLAIPTDEFKSIATQIGQDPINLDADLKSRPGKDGIITDARLGSFVNSCNGRLSVYSQVLF